MFQRIRHTWSLMKSGWRVLFRDPEMLVFPLVSGLACLVLLATFAVPIFLSESWGWSKTNRETEQQVLYFSCWFVSYMALYFVVYFFNSAMVACAVIRMKGGDPTLGDGFRAAFSRLPAILGWTLLAGSIGLLLKLIEARFKKVGEIVAGILGCAWTLASFLAVPVLVLEGKGPIEALKESTRMLRNTWGEQLLGTFGFGIIFFLLNIPALLLIFAGVALGVEHESWKLFVSVAGSGVLWIILLSLAQSAVLCIFQAAVYLYARDGVVPEGFDAEALRG
jgi:hypothetical protein